MHDVADRLVTLAEVYYLDSAQSQDLENRADEATYHHPYLGSFKSIGEGRRPLWPQNMRT